MTIWKYKLKTEFNEVDVPKGATFLSVDSQTEIVSVNSDGSPEVEENMVVYALVDPDEKGVEKRVLQVVGTGHGVEFRVVDCPKAMFLGTVKLQGGRFMFHIFEREHIFKREGG